MDKTGTSDKPQTAGTADTAHTRIWQKHSAGLGPALNKKAARPKALPSLQSFQA